MADLPKMKRSRNTPDWQSLLISGVVGAIYYFSNPKPQNQFDYTFRVAANFLAGSIAFADKQPTWLNEFVPFDGSFYSVFPLGAVLSMIPFAFLKVVGLINAFPAGWIAALTAVVTCYFLLKIAAEYRISRVKRLLLTMAIMFGTFMWTNLVFAGAWQLALGFAMVGELGAIYFTAYRQSPLLAGLFFALGFGNRTEILLTAPIFMCLLLRDRKVRAKNLTEALDNFSRDSLTAERRGLNLVRKLASFSAIPFVLGIATLAYNYIRFHSMTDFGYARIPGVLQEPWYDHGIFSPYYIPRQMWEMLFKLWELKDLAPLPTPNGFSGSILISSPFLLLAFRFGSRDKLLKYLSWASVFVLTLLLWMHGNSGGWQFGYRYAMVLLPWIFVILLENSRKTVRPYEWLLYGLSFIANIYATWLFHWTQYIRP